MAVDIGSVHNLGLNGNLHSNTATTAGISSGRSRHIAFFDNAVLPSNGATRSGSFPIRCNSLKQIS